MSSTMINDQIMNKILTRVHIPICPVELATRHKPFPNKIRVVRLLAVLSCKSNVVHVDFDNSIITVGNERFEL